MGSQIMPRNQARELKERERLLTRDRHPSCAILTTFIAFSEPTGTSNVNPWENRPIHPPIAP